MMIPEAVDATLNRSIGTKNSKLVFSLLQLSVFLKAENTLGDYSR